MQVLCYGDSNTWGYRPETDDRLIWEERYPGILSKRLGAGYRVTENGLCGRTTCFDSTREPYVNGLEEANVCTLVHAPIDIAVVMLGTNDCKDEYGAEVDDIGQGMEKVAEVFEHAGAHIILAAPPVLRGLEKSPFYREFGRGAEEKSRRLAACYQSLASRRGWQFLNVDTVARAGNLDRIHLDKEGHRRLAEGIYRMIARKEERDEQKHRKSIRRE